MLFVALSLIVLAARQMGSIFARFKLPLISGFLFAGIIAGPFVLDFIHADTIPRFLILDELVLAFIAFAAGAELERRIIQGYLRSIMSLIGAQVVAVMVIGVIAFVLLKDMVPFMAGLPDGEVLAIALLGSTVMIARSPSSALAIIKELRARGPFTHKVLGATVLMDAVVIIIFAAAVSVAAVLVEGVAFETSLLGFVLLEITLDIGLGIIVGLVLTAIMYLPFEWLKRLLILLLGLSIFLLSTRLHNLHPFGLPVGLFSEPLLIGLIAGFYVTNYTKRASDFRHTLEQMSPAVFLVFFTLVGLELELDVLGQTWGIVLILVVVRILAIIAGSVAGTLIAQDHSPGNALLGLGFVTQAGVSIGLAKEIGVEFPAWGPELATLSIGIVVLNQVLGPPILTWAIKRVGEAHTAAESPTVDGVLRAIIFGVEGQSLTLARQLESQGWRVKLVTRVPEILADMHDQWPRIELLPSITEGALRHLDTDRADSVVLMLSDEENYALCGLIYEKFGVENVVVRLQEPANFGKFNELGAVVVDPGTAIVSLLEQFVRSPSTTTLLLGMDPNRDVMEIEMNSPTLHGIAIRDIRLPSDVLIVSITRREDRLLSHGYTRLEIGDRVTLVGQADSLEEIRARFEA